MLLKQDRTGLISKDKENEKKKKKEDNSLFTGNSKFSRAIRRIEEISILVVAHIITDARDILYIRTLLTGVLESFIFGQGLDAIYISELNR